VNRVIVTGGTGFIGRHVVRRLVENKQCSVALIANAPSLDDRELPGATPLTFYEADIRDRQAILTAFRNEKADTCIHLAAKISVTDSIRKPKETMDINVKGTLNVLDACYASGIDNFVFASSAAVYGDVKELPISENQKLRPLSPYGTSKMMAEQHVINYSRLKKIQNTISLRIFNVYGSGQVKGSDVVTKFARRLSKGLPPIIHGRGEHTRDFIYVDDVADSILLSISAMEKQKNNNNYNLSSPPIFNIGTGTPTSINELAHKIINISGLELTPVYAEQNQDDGVILHSYADTTKARKALNFVPKKSIDEGLRDVLNTI
jgi:UDP-glucose 4-epimerase